MHAALHILLVEDDAVLRDTMGSNLASVNADWEIDPVGSLTDARKKDLSSYSLALIDLGLPDGSGLDLIADIRRQSEHTKIIVITIFGDERNVLAAIAAGADGYLLKDSGLGQLAAAISSIFNGEAPISPAIAGHLLKALRQPDTRPLSRKRDASVKPLMEELTQREMQILDVLARGFSYREIADLLSISYATVNQHIKAIYRKLQVHSKNEAVFEALRAGLIEVTAD